MVVYKQAKYPWVEVGRNHWINDEHRKKEIRSFEHVRWNGSSDEQPTPASPEE